jgi:hypothetical protein
LSQSDPDLDDLFVFASLLKLMSKKKNKKEEEEREKKKD